MKKKPYSDQRWWDDPKPKMCACGNCAHYDGFLKCKAFPERIPNDLLTVEISHDKPYPNDGGYRYTPKSKTEETT